MPELPDLEALVGFLSPTLEGKKIEQVEVLHPITIRRPIAEFSALLGGNAFHKVARRGKFILFSLASGHVLAINLMLAGRLQYCLPRERRRARTCFILHLEDGRQLRYFDDKMMGKVYLVKEVELGLIPRFSEMGPEANE